MLNAASRSSERRTENHYWINKTVIVGDLEKSIQWTRMGESIGGEDLERISTDDS